MMPSTEMREELERAAVGRHLVRVYREDFETGAVDGYVVGMGPVFFALEIISDRITYNGFSCMRYIDVTGCDVPVANADFQERALKLKGERCDSRYNVDLSSLRDLLESAAARYPLLAIHLEGEDPDVCFIGRLVEVGAETLAMQLISDSAIWEDGSEEFELGEITRVDFGGGYEEALRLVAENPA